MKDHKKELEKALPPGKTVTAEDAANKDSSESQLAGFSALTDACADLKEILDPGVFSGGVAARAFGDNGKDKTWAEDLGRTFSWPLGKNPSYTVLNREEHRFVDTLWKKFCDDASSRGKLLAQAAV